MSEKYGCFNRQPFREHVIVQDGWAYGIVNGVVRRNAELKAIPFRMSRECSYANETVLGRQDPKCAGCRWRKEVTSADIL